MEEPLYCHECGREFFISDEGVSFHVDEQGEVDFNADADHVAFTHEQVEFISSCH